jgi:hypothetical protein
MNEIVHILAGEIRVGVERKEAQVETDDQLSIKLSWSPKNVERENAPHPTNQYEK